MTDNLLDEYERLSALVDRQLGDCIGCRHDEGPDEVCPHHGRSYSEWVQIASDVIGRHNDLTAERDAARVEVDTLRAQIARVEAVVVRLRDYNGGFDQIRQERKDIGDVIDAAIESADALWRAAKLRGKAPAALAGAVPGSPPVPGPIADELVREAIARGEGHALSEAMRRAVVLGSPETRQEEQR